MRLAAIDARASARGLHIGQSVSDARAQVPDLEMREIDRQRLEHLFSEFADWHTNASPLVGILAHDLPYGDLCLDVTGVTHLFGEEENLLSLMTGRLEALGFTLEAAIADTIGAAWGLARYRSGSIVVQDGLADALADLPVAALRLDETQITSLRQVGLKHIGQLYSRDRKSLQARFGASLVMRLDQALGRLEERIDPRLPVSEYFAERRFNEPIGLIDDVLMCAEDLAVQLSLKLEQEDVGAQAFHLVLYLVDHKVIRLSVNASRATRDPSHIARLFKHRAERLAGEYDPGFGIDTIRLWASSVSDVTSMQIGAFEAGDDAATLERLFDRMTSRLGPLAVVRSKPVDTHIPERAVKLEPVVARTMDDPVPAIPPRTRPLRLLPMPELITVIAEVPDGPPLSMLWRRVRHRFTKVTGPERIEAEWWRSGARLLLAPEIEKEEPEETREGKSPLPPSRYIPKLSLFEPEAKLRDYYIAEDDGGRRFWIFREGLYGEFTVPQWFLHGIFA